MPLYCGNLLSLLYYYDISILCVAAFKWYISFATAKYNGKFPRPPQQYSSCGWGGIECSKRANVKVLPDPGDGWGCGWIGGRNKTEMTAAIVNNGLKWKKIMIRNPTYTRLNNNKHCIIKMMYFIERIYYVPTLLSGRNTINLRLISDYRNEDKDLSPELRWKARVNMRVS